MDGRAASQTITDRLPGLMAKGVSPVILSAPTGCKDNKFPHFQLFSLAPSGLLFEIRQIIDQKIKNLLFKKFCKVILTILLLPFYLLEKIFFHRDSQWSWYIGAALKGILLIRKYQPTLIYTTAGPPSTHLAGYYLHKWSGLPWLAEIHDPLISDAEPLKNQHYYFKKNIENRISQFASAAIYFTENAAKNAFRRHPFKGSLHVIRPGAKVPSINPPIYKKRNKIHFGHFGSLAEDRNLASVIKAFFDLFHENPDWRDLVCLDLFGGSLDSITSQAVDHYSMEHCVVQYDRLEYDPKTQKSGRQQVFEEMCLCNVLLLIHGKGYVCAEYIPSKMYEYLLTGRPILGLASKDSELYEILGKCGHTAIDIDDFNGLKNAITLFVKNWQKDGLPSFTNRIPFTIANTVNKLLEIEASIS